MTDTPFKIGDSVMKITGDYHAPGFVVATYPTMSGKPRLVVELPGGIQHIFAPTNLEPLTIDALDKWFEQINEFYVAAKRAIDD